MSREISFNGNLSITKRDTDANQTPLIAKVYSGNFLDDMSGRGGPYPGIVTANIKGSGGTQVPLTNLVFPRWTVFEHRGRADGSANQAGDYVNVGIYDSTLHKYYPLLELFAGLKLPVPLSRDLLTNFLGPGTGTGGHDTCVLMLLAYPVAQKVSVEAYDR